MNNCPYYREDIHFIYIHRCISVVAYHCYYCYILSYIRKKIALLEENHFVIKQINAMFTDYKVLCKFF